MLSQPTAYVYILLASTTILTSSLPTLPDPEHISSLCDSTILSANRPNTLNTIDPYHSLISLNLPILPQAQTIQLTRLTNTPDLSQITSSTSTTHLLRRSSLSITPGGSLLLKATGSTFLAPITLGTQTFNVVVDTGSSDTWVSKADFTCVDVATNKTRLQSSCAFGGSYDTEKEGSTASIGNKFKEIDNVNFNVTYGDGEYLTGIFGKIDVTLANVKVPNQQVALATVAAWRGDGITSGILGLAYPALTAAYSGSDLSADRYCYSSTSAGQQCNQLEYPPVLTSTFSQNLTSAIFAVALSCDESRSGKGGYLSVGGVMDTKMVGVKDGATFASTQVKMLKGDGKFRYYLVEVDGVAVLPVGVKTPAEKRGGDEGEAEVEVEIEEQEVSDTDGMGTGGMKMRRGKIIGSVLPAISKSTIAKRAAVSSISAKYTTMSTPSLSSASSTPTSATTTTTAGILAGSANLPFIVDTGTTLSFLPRPLIQRYLSMFSPSGTYNSTNGFWFVNCSARVPPLGIKIGGKTFWHNEKDLIKWYDRSGNRCISGVQESTGLGVNILGDVWLDSVLVVFDLRDSRKGLIRVASRREYVS